MKIPLKQRAIITPTVH